MKTAMLAGATGLVGQQLLDLLLKSNRYSDVKVLSRRLLSVQHPVLHTIVLDFDNLHAYASQLKADDVFCCLGTTMRQAGSKDAFRHVDFDYPVELARITHALGASQYFLVSATGADRHSVIYYNRIKGETEAAIHTISFNTVHIFRPSLLLGPRKEKRIGEDVAKVLFRIFDLFIPLKNKAIDSSKVARAMLHYATQELAGVHVHESASLQKF